MTTELKDLELDVLTWCFDTGKAARKAAESLDGYKFSERSSQWIWRSLKDTYAKHGKIPQIKVLAFKAQNDITNDDLFDEVIAGLRALKQNASPGELDTLLPEIIKAYNRQKILETVDQLIDIADGGDMDEAQGIMVQGSRTINRRGERTGSGGVVEIARMALAEDDTGDYVPTGLAWVDKRIRGIAKGQVFLMTGITGIGKSVSTIQSGHGALRVGARIAHFTTEMSREMVMYRYLSRFTGIPEQHIRERRMSTGEQSLLAGWLDRNEERMNDLLKIEQVMPNSGSIADIQAGLDELERDGTPADMVIIDSPDHLGSMRKYGNARDESTEVWWGVKAIAERGHAVWATSQINRGKWEFMLATPEAVADNYNKARIADAFFSVNWCLDDKGRSTGHRRLYWGKYRSGTSRHIIPLRCDLNRMIMVTEQEPEELVTKVVH
jgi:replicative DNA helicase